MSAMNRKAGFSLIEVMVAILILGVAMVGLMMGITAALSSNKESEIQTVAALVAAGQIELLRADALLTDGETEGQCGEGLSLYRWKQSVTGAGINGLHEVKVTVENSKSGQSVYELQTMLFDPPIDLPPGKSSSAKDSKSNKRGRRNQ